MGEVVQAEFITEAEIDPDQMLEANKGSLKSLFLLGYDKENRFIMASSTGDLAGDNLMLDLAKHHLVQLAEAINEKAPEIKAMADELKAKPPGEVVSLNPGSPDAWQ